MKMFLSPQWIKYQDGVQKWQAVNLVTKYYIYLLLFVILKNNFYIISESNMCRIPVHKPRSLNFGQSQTDFDSFLSCKYKSIFELSYLLNKIKKILKNQYYNY